MKSMGPSIMIHGVPWHAVAGELVPQHTMLPLGDDVTAEGRWKPALGR